MKKIILGFAMVLSVNALASDYVCTASLIKGETEEKQVLGQLARTERIAQISTFVFNSSQTGEGALTLMIFNRAKAFQMTKCLTFSPQPGKPTSLLLRLEDGAAVIDCEAK